METNRGAQNENKTQPNAHMISKNLSTIPKLRSLGRLPVHVQKFAHVRVLEVLE